MRPSPCYEEYVLCVSLPFSQKLLELGELPQAINDHPYFKNCGGDMSEWIPCITHPHTHTHAHTHMHTQAEGGNTGYSTLSSTLFYFSEDDDEKKSAFDGIANNHSPVSKFPAPQPPAPRREGSAMVTVDRLSASWTNDSDKLVLNNITFEVNKVSGRAFEAHQPC